MKIKETKSDITYCVHYDIERVKLAKLSADDIKQKGKVQYKIIVKYLVPRNNGGLLKAEERTTRKQVSCDVLLKKRLLLDENIIRTKKEFIAEAGSKGITGDMLTEIMRKKGFGHEGK